MVYDFIFSQGINLGINANSKASLESVSYVIFVINVSWKLLYLRIQLSKGLALQYILYSDLRPGSNSRSNFLVKSSKKSGQVKG